MHPTAFINCQIFFTLLDSHLSNVQQSNSNYVYDILDVGSQDHNGNQFDCITSTPFHINHDYKYTGMDFNISAANVDVAMDEDSKWPFSTGNYSVHFILSVFPFL